VQKPVLVQLIPHPATPCPEVDSIEVRLLAEAQHVRLEYRIEGRVDRLAVPAPCAGTRVDGLWQHTCGEAFIGRRGASSYREFNFAPSRSWAAYDFSDTRRRIADPPVDDPVIETQSTASGLHVAVRIARQDLGASGACELGLSAVVETLDGRLSYWALRHPSPQPDFHHRAAFALPLELTP
jgi:hypothetical protein